MKIYLVLLSISLMKLFASEPVHGQKVSIKVENEELTTIFSQIEKDIPYTFFYNNSLVDVSVKASLKVEQEEINVVLGQLLARTNIDFRIFKSQIVLFPRDDASVIALMEELPIGESAAKNSKDSISTRHDMDMLVNKLTQDPVTGTVTDKNGLPLAGVNVLVKGTTRGIQTDFDGNYQIIADEGDVLEFSYLGMETKSITIGTYRTINVTLEDSMSVLDEVIVVAYGTAKKTDFTGSAVKIDADEIANRPIANVTQALQGAAAGVNVSATSGQPGAGPNIQIRGSGSFTASSEPLYIVDGVQFGGDLASLNANDIESLTVLKDAASTSLYGARAANGVVVITTKRGREGKSTATLNISQGTTSRSIPEYNRVNAQQYYPLMWEARRNALSISGSTPVEEANQQASEQVFRLLGYNPFSVPNDQIVLANGQLNPDARLLYPDDLDWQKELVRGGTRRNIDFAYSGANENSDFYASLGYLSEEGYVINSDFERITARVNVNTKINDCFRAGINLGGATSVSNQAASEGTGTSTLLVNPFNTTRYIAPIYPVFEHDPVTGEFILDENGDRIYDLGDQRIGSTSGRHVIWETLLNQDRDEITNLSGRTFAEFTFLKDFTFTFNATLDKRFFWNEDFQNPTVGDGNPLGRSSRLSFTETTVNYNQLLNYSRNFGKHSVAVLLGHENYDYELQLVDGTRQDIVADGNTELINFVTTTNLTSYSRALTREGYFSRLNYNYDDRYFLSGSFRKDASSRFSQDARWGNFFSVGGSWKIDGENFMDSVSWVNLLKLRASYGEVGNDNIEFDNGVANYYPSQALFALNFNNANEGGILSSDVGNVDLKWETNIQSDVAMEFAIFNNRIAGTLEYYRRKSDDLLFNVPLPVSSGLDEVPQNFGSWVNSGIEIDLTFGIVRTEDFSWNLNINAATLKNEITRLPQEELINGSKKLVEGGDIYDFWLRDWYGVDPADGAGLYILDTELGAIGDADVREVNGTIVTTNQNKAKFDFVGKATPDLFGAFTNNINYKNLQFGFTFTYQIGGQTYDTNYAGLMSSGDYGDALHTDILQRWQQPGDVTDVPRLDANQLPAFGAASDRWLIGSDFLALRQANLTYNFDGHIPETMGLSALQVYLSGENLLLFSKRTGLDVVQNFQGTTTNRFTPSRIITLGLNITF